MKSIIARAVSATFVFAAVLGFSACSIGTFAPVGKPSAAASGVNSSFSRTGVEEIARSREAQIDLRSGRLTAEQLGVAEGETLWDVNVPVSDPVSLTVLGSGGTLTGETSVIRVLADPDGDVRTISYFLFFSEADELTERVREDAPHVGIDSADLASFLNRPTSKNDFQLVLNRGTALGFQVSITITIDAEKPRQVLQYTITPASRARR